MKKFNYLYLAGIACLASCSSDEFIGEQGYLNQNGNGEISFSAKGKAVTRSTLTGKDAATKLQNQFVVFGSKSASSTVTDVFKNYVVEYAENTANTTASNTKNWEYVGKASYEAAKTTPIANSQTIKYWDWSADQYVFTAVASKADIASGAVKVSKTMTGSPSVTDITVNGGYTLTLYGANLDQLYISDRVEILSTGASATNQDRDKVNTYGGNVTLTFRQPFTKVRVGFYETIPGYSVAINEFKVVDSDNPAFSAAATVGMWGTNAVEYTQSGSENGFAANFPNKKISTGNTTATEDKNLVVKYLSNNQPTVEWDGATKANILNLGTNVFTSPLAIASTTPTWDQNDGGYSYFQDNTSNTKPLMLCVSYTLTSTDGSGETIKVKDATAVIPKEYLTWKTNTAYTYLFKISDKTNGVTGTHDNPTGLFPITFDAYVETTEDGIQNTITSVSDPSITTYATTANTIKEAPSTLYNEYKKGAKIWASAINNGVGMVTFTAATAIATPAATECGFYEVTNVTAPNENTEANVLHALQNYTGLTFNSSIKGRNGITLTYKSTTINTSPEKPDGVDDEFTISQLASFTTDGGSGKTYAFVYVKTAATATNDVYEVKSFTNSQTPENTYWYCAKSNLTQATGSTGSSGTHYFKKDGDRYIDLGSSYTGTIDANTFIVASDLTQCNGSTADPVTNIYFAKYTKSNGVYGVKVIKTE